MDTSTTPLLAFSAVSQSYAIGSGQRTVTPRTRGRSPQTSAVYPTAWQRAIPHAGLELEVVAAMPKQAHRSRLIPTLPSVGRGRAGLAARATGRTGLCCADRLWACQPPSPRGLRTASILPVWPGGGLREQTAYRFDNW